MENAEFTTHVSGMTCRPCEDAIMDALLGERGVLRAEVSYWKALVTVTYDPQIVSQQRLGELLCAAGYPPCGTIHGGVVTELLTAAAALLLAAALPYLPLPGIPQVQAGASYLFLFLVGVITGTHCICMCGGILLSQTASRDLKGEKRGSALPFVYYQAGRLLGCTALGVVFGAAGNVLTYSVKAKSMIYTLCGAGVLFIGLCMWGIIPALRRVQAQLPALCRLPVGARRVAKGRPLLVGVLNALLPCAASGAMWLYAASTGSALRGGLALLVWCVGTMPVMGIFSLAGKLLPQRGLRLFERVSVVILLAMGLRMAEKGLLLVL